LVQSSEKYSRREFSVSTHLFKSAIDIQTQVDWDVVAKELGYDNVSVKVGDGYLGWPECGPFDAMVVTAALDHVPPPLIEQLKVGGRLIMPLGSAHASQQLTVIEKTAPSETRTRSITLVAFVPFIRSKD